jgi:hypothetical protein
MREVIYSESLMCAELTDKTEHVYGDTRYAANSWKRERRVIFKAEVVRADGKEPRDNPRFVVTNMEQTPQWIYEEVYCPRGNVENRIKELKALDVDRTSCTNFWANQLRVLMAAAAYVLLQEIRLNAELTTLARAQAWNDSMFMRIGNSKPYLILIHSCLGQEWIDIKIEEVKPSSGH